MTEQTDAAEVERAMTEAVMYLGDWETQTSEEIGAELAHVLSDWLAAREAAARAEERERVAAAIEALAETVCKGCNSCDGSRHYGMRAAAELARTDGAGS